MIRTFTQQFDKFTLAVITSVFILTVFTISTIHYVFVERLILKDAHNLSEDVATQIRGEFFTEGVTLDRMAPGASSDQVRASVSRGIQLKPKNSTSYMNLPKFTAKPLVDGDNLNRLINNHVGDHNYLNALESYGVYLPSGTVFLPQKEFRENGALKKFTSSFRIISSVQSVFINGKSLYAFRENEFGAYTQHYIPLFDDGNVIAVVMLEAIQTTAGTKMAKAVSNAVYFTTIAGIPVILLMMYLGWMRFKDKLQAQEQISFLASNDHLTELPNRSAFNAVLERSIDNANMHDEKFAIFSLDLDGFNQINDVVGHSAGDRFLINIAKRLDAHKPSTSTLARIAGDEFSLILPDVSTPEKAAEIAQTLLSQILLPFPGPGEEISCTGSIGVAFGPENGQDGETLFKNAKLALYRAKQDGGNSFRFFEPNMDRALQARRELERSLSLAIKREEFEIYYQPQVELSGAKVIGYEALLRWNHPERGMVSPVEFIPVLEETKMIVEVGEYVLRRACREALNWKDDAKVAVNLSTVQFEHQDVPEMVARALADSGLAAERLEIEITESILMSDTDAALETLARLKEVGVNIAMDDFGTGYSSLSYISEFDFDKIKIDRSFVSSIQDDERARAIISTVIGLGRALGIMITAEGIETNEQLLLIQAAGCHFGQGYLFGKPVPLDQISFEEDAEEEQSQPVILSAYVA